MCVGTLQAHAKCHHPKQMIDAKPCSDYDAATKTCYGVFEITGEDIILAPSLCRSCYNLVEEDIFKKCEDAVINTEKEIADLTLDLETEIDRTRRTMLMELRRTLFFIISDRKNARERELAAFRSAQGVWGDG